jgi:hypothetical protein
MAVAWPSAVPFTCDINSLTESDQDVLVRFKPDFGLEKLRPRTSTYISIIKYQKVLTTTQWDILMAFYRSDCKNGSQQFTTNHPRTSVAITAQFNTMPTMRSLDSSKVVQATIELIVTPTTSLPSSLVGYSAESTQFFLRLATVPTTARRTAYATLIDSLVAANVWQQLDALYILAAADAATANTNLKQSAGTLTPVNAPAFTVDKGYLPNGATSSYLNTGINTSTFGGHYTTTSGTYFGWAGPFSPLKQGTNTGLACSFIIGINEPGGNQDSIGPSMFGSGEAFGCQVNDGSTFNVPIGIAASGLYAGDRSGTTVGAYYNGVQLGTATHAGAALFNSNVLIGTAQDTTVANNYSPNNIAAAGFGGSLGLSGQVALYSAINTYLSTVGFISSDPYTAFINRLQTTPSGPRQTLYQTLINNLISDGVWQKLDVLWVLAAADSVTARTNLVQDRYVANRGGGGGGGDLSVSGPTFTTDRGYTMVATNNNTNNFGTPLYDPSDPTRALGNAKFLQNDAHCMLWQLAEGQFNDEETTFNNNHTCGMLIQPRGTSNQAFGEINTDESIGSGNATVSSVTSAIGMFTVTRSVASFCTLYVHQGAAPGTVQSGVQNRVSKALAGADAGGPAPWTLGSQATRQYAAASIGRSLTATDEQNLYNRLYAYLHAVGAA